MGEKVIHHEPVHVGKGNLTLGAGISTMDSGLVPGKNSDPSGEISLSAWTFMMDCYSLHFSEQSDQVIHCL